MKSRTKPAAKPKPKPSRRMKLIESHIEKLDSTELYRIQGKSMFKNKSPQIVRDYMSSYAGYICDERIIAHEIVERDSFQNHAGRKQVTTT